MDNIIELIEGISKDYNISSLRKPLRVVQNMLEQNPVIDIAVIGQFKAGKSSFINSFIGRQILPVGAIPVTSVITRIEYGEEEKVNIYSLDGSKKEVSIDEIENYISEQKNPANQKQVDIVDIYLTSLAEFRDLRFIDTPGIGSIHKHNTETTNDWLPNASIALLIINSGQPLSEKDFILLEKAKSFCTQICIIISKADLLPETDLNEVIKYIDNSLKSRYNKGFPLFTYSIYSQTELHKAEIKQRLLLPLTENFGEEFNRIIKHKINTLTQSCISYLEIAHKASEHNYNEREKLKKEILDEKLNSKYIKNDLKLVINNHKAVIREKMREEILEKYLNEVALKIEKDFDKNFHLWRGNLNRLTQKYEKWLNDVLNSELAIIMNKEAEETGKIINNEKDNIIYYIDSICKKLNENLKKNLEIELAVVDPEFKADIVQKPDISIYWTFDNNIDSLWFIIPMPVFRGAFRKYFRSKIYRETEKNLNRLVSLISGQIEAILNDLYMQSLNYITTELDSIGQLLMAKDESTSQIKMQIDKLKIHHISKI